MNRIAVGLVCLSAALSLSVARPAAAQVTFGEIAGRVSDAQGSIVPGATVTATNAASAFSRTTVSGALGDFVLTQLPPGRYEVLAERTGFRRALVRDVEVNVGTRQTLNFDLAVGNVTETVEVAASATLIETTSSELEGVVTPREIQNLPLLNRTFAGLALVMPEARPVGAYDPTKTRLGSIGMSGGDGRQLDVNVDGGDNKDNAVGGLLQNFAYESIQEFQVVQHRWTAESGRAVGGVLNVVTKSGTNTLRGSAFGNFRTNETRASDFFEVQANRDKAAFERQEFGGSFGGPISRDRLFFFGAAERFRERQQTQVLASAIPQLAAIPGTNPVSEIPTPYDDTLVSVKVDHQISGNQNASYRFSSQNSSSPNDQVASPARTDLTGGNTNQNDVYSLVASHTAVLGANQLNQFTFHFQDFRNELLGVTDTPNLLFPNDLQTGANVNTPQATIETKYQFRNDFTRQVGSHAAKFGANYILTKLDGYFYFGAKGYQLRFFDEPLTITGTPSLYPQGFETPGAVQQLNFFAGEASHKQTFHQMAFYAQDDWRVTPNLTLNLGLRYDANVGILFDQTDNRTIQILSQLNDPRAQAITADRDKLANKTPSWTEFQPRLGFAYDLNGKATTVLRGGYGLFYDQIFQNLTLFSYTQIGNEIYQQVLGLQNTAVGQGQLATYRYGVDPFPAPQNLDTSQLAVGSFGRINDPDMKDPHVHKFSIGFQRALSPRYTLTSDYVHTRGENESRVQVINPRISEVCNPLWPGATPADPRCVRGVNTRYFDRAFVDAGLPAGRLEQINMIGTTNSSRYDSWTTTLRGRRDRMQFSISYVLANSRSWGGQPTASYTSNAIATTPENQFKDEEWGPSRFDERHRIVLSGVFDLPWGIQASPVMQYATSRPYSPTVGLDLDGDGLTMNDRVCESTDLRAVFDARGNSAAIQALNPRGCTQLPVNSERSGFFVDSSGNVQAASGRYFNTDLRVSKSFPVGRYNIRAYVDMYNLFDTTNVSLSNRFGQTPATSSGSFLQPQSLYGPGFGPPVGRPFIAVLGARLDF